MSAELKTILLVEDDPGISGAIKDLLETVGYPVATAANGSEALDRLRGGLLPGLIFLDLMMPVMDGATFAAAYQTDAALTKRPIYLVTASGITAQEAVALGAIGCLTKPLDVDQLLDTVERVVGRP